MMTRRDYIALSNALRKARGQPFDCIVREVADTMEKDDPNFHREVFYLACGFTPKEVKELRFKDEGECDE